MRLWSYCDQLNVRRQLYITALLRVDLWYDDTVMMMTLMTATMITMMTLIMMMMMMTLRWGATSAESTYILQPGPTNHPATRSRLILAIYILQSTAAATAAADKKGAFQVVVVGWPRINWIATALLQLP